MITEDGLWAALRNPSDCSVLSHSLNRVYLVRAMPSPKFLASVGTSDILKTLGDMLYFHAQDQTTLDIIRGNNIRNKR